MKRLILTSCLAVMLIASTASATLVYSTGTGNQMAGGTLTVTFQNAGAVAAPIVAGPAALEGSATVPGAFSFSVIGDTFANLWSLTNLKDDDFIVVADFFLPPSISLFDDDSSPSTPDNLAGELGATSVAGPLIVASNEYFPWLDAQNLGDVYLGEVIQWAQNTFPTGQTCTWWDDTDYSDYIPIPEPATISLLGLGSLVLLRKRRA